MADLSGASDEKLVDMAGLMGVRAVTGGLAQPDPRGFQAQAELMRRTSQTLQETQEELKSSAASLRRWTILVVVLTLVLVGLTVALLVGEA